MNTLKIMINQQLQKLLKLAALKYPSISAEDLLQPNDFEKLEEDPIFRYEEGVLHGFQAALKALEVDSTFLDSE